MENGTCPEKHSRKILLTLIFLLSPQGDTSSKTVGSDHPTGPACPANPVRINLFQIEVSFNRGFDTDTTDIEIPLVLPGTGVALIVNLK